MSTFSLSCRYDRHGSGHDCDHPRSGLDKLAGLFELEHSVRGNLGLCRNRTASPPESRRPQGQHILLCIRWVPRGIWAPILVSHIALPTAERAVPLALNNGVAALTTQGAYALLVLVERTVAPIAEVVLQATAPVSPPRYGESHVLWRAQPTSGEYLAVGADRPYQGLAVLMVPDALTGMATETLTRPPLGVIQGHAQLTLHTEDRLQRPGFYLAWGACPGERRTIERFRQALRAQRKWSHAHERCETKKKPLYRLQPGRAVRDSGVKADA